MRTFEIDCTGEYTLNYFVRGIRETGGLGDVVRCLAVFQGLRKKYPFSRLHFFCPRYLLQLIQPRTNCIDCFVPLERRTREGKLVIRRKGEIDEDLFPHLKRGIEYNESINLFCPAYDHEVETEGLVCQERTEIWCQEANVEVSRPKLIPTKQDFKVMENYKNNYNSIIGIQIGATCRSREWPFEYWNALIQKLQAKQIKVIIFDAWKRWDGKISTKNVEVCINGSWPDVCGKILACDLMITPDSGFYHLSGALKAKTLGIFGSTSGKVISRIWNLEKQTHYYLQLTEDQIDSSLLPKSNSTGKPCNPICYMRWSRGWDEKRYRKDQQYCAIIKQITPDLVFQKALSLLE